MLSIIISLCEGDVMQIRGTISQWILRLAVYNDIGKGWSAFLRYLQVNNDSSGNICRLQTENNQSANFDHGIIYCHILRGFNCKLESYDSMHKSSNQA